jgi:hypothetical protein
VSTGWCFICNRGIDADMADHLAQDHPTPSRKIRAQPMSWEHRTQSIIGALERVLEEEDRNKQISILDDEVLQELYLVRARLAALRGTPTTRVKEGSNGSS